MNVLDIVNLFVAEKLKDKAIHLRFGILFLIVFSPLSTVFAEELANNNSLLEQSNLKYYLIPGVVMGNPAVGKKYTFNGENDSGGIYGIDLIGRCLYNRLFLDLSYFAAQDMDILDAEDSYALNVYQGFVGYRFPISALTALSLKIGLSNWKFRSDEGRLFHPGEERSKLSNGKDRAYGVDIETKKTITSKHSFIYSYRRYEFDFAGFDTISFGAAIEFFR